MNNYIWIILASALLGSQEHQAIHHFPECLGEDKVLYERLLNDETRQYWINYRYLGTKDSEVWLSAESDTIICIDRDPISSWPWNMVKYHTKHHYTGSGRIKPRMDYFFQMISCSMICEEFE